MNNFTTIPNEWLDHQADMGLSAPELVFLAHARRHQYHDSAPFPSLPTIARKMSMSVRHVRRIAAEVEKRGLLTRRIRPGKSSQLEMFATPDPGHPCPGSEPTPDVHVRPPRTPVSGDPGRTCPPKNINIRRQREEDKAANAAVVSVADAYRQNIHPGACLTDGARTKIQTRLKTYSPDDLDRAIQNFARAPWWMEHNAHRGMAWFFHTDDRIEQFLNLPKPSDNGRARVMVSCPKCHSPADVADGVATCPNGCQKWRVPA